MRNRLNAAACLAAALLVSLSFPSVARAGGVVSTCDQTHLQTALSGGGLVTFACSGDIALSSTITISANTTIDATGYSVTLDGGSKLQVMTVNSGMTLSINHLTIANGSTTTATSGAGIGNSGTLIVTNSIFSNNTSLGYGGGIYSQGTLLVTNSTFSNNSGSLGGGITNGGGTAVVTNSTFYDNKAPGGDGGGIETYSGALTVINSTFSNNSATVGGGIANYGTANTGTATLENTIVVGSGASGGDCANSTIYGQITDGGYNLDDDGTCGFSSANHSFSKDTSVNFASLQNNGGPTQTFALNYPSDAIGAIPAGTNGCATSIAIDQRGVTRPGSVNGNCSIGAYEYVSGTSASDGVTVTTISNCTSDSQIQNAVSAGGRIVFACSGDIPLTKTLAIGANTAIDATGQIVTLDGQHSLQVLNANSGATLSLNNLTIANGNAGGDEGGGVYDDAGTLVVTNSTVSGNNAAEGGAIENAGGTVIATNSTFSANSASYGGGIDDGTGVAIVTNSTFSANTATQFGGGISSDGTLKVTGSTFSGNSATSGGGAIEDESKGVLENTILANSTSGEECQGNFTDNGYNLADDSSCGLSATGSQNSATGLNLGSLWNNGGPTLTIPLNAGSVALGAIPLGSSGCGTVSSNTTTPILTDQRGVFRPQQGTQGAACDIGALETAQNQVQVTFNTSPQSLAYSVGPSNYKGQQTLTLPAGTQSTVWTPSPQTSPGAQYTFASWSDNGAQAHPITISPALTALTASFNAFYQLTTGVSPSGTGTVSVSASKSGNNGYYPSGTQITLAVNANSGYVFKDWNQSAVTTNPLVFNLTAPTTETAYFVSAATFTITPNPQNETVSHGNIAGFILKLKSVDGFIGNVKLSCSGGPAGSYCVDFPMTVHLNGTARAISGIFFPKNTKPGIYTITFTGVSGVLTSTATAKFTVK